MLLHRLVHIRLGGLHCLQLRFESFSLALCSLELALQVLALAPGFIALVWQKQQKRNVSVQP